ncbi:unnamed protein product, partial [Ostreobium quekettii]
LSRVKAMSTGSLELPLVSPELLWSCVANRNAFRVKGFNGAVLSREPGNLMGLRSQKFSGLVHPTTIDIQAAPDKDEGVVVTTSLGDKANTPALGKKTKKVKKGNYGAYQACLKKTLKGAGRPDLDDAVVRRVKKIVKSKIYKQNHKR